MNGNNDSYRQIMADQDRVNEIFRKKVGEWTQEEKDFVNHWVACKNPIGVGSGVGGYYYPSEEELACEHKWVEKALLTSVYEECELCGESK